MNRSGCAIVGKFVGDFVTNPDFMHYGFTQKGYGPPPTLPALASPPFRQATFPAMALPTANKEEDQNNNSGTEEAVGAEVMMQKAQ